jgi:glycerol uptake facilitator-like aquaporin
MSPHESSNTGKVQQRKAQRVFKGAVVRIESQQIVESSYEQGAASEEYDVPSTGTVSFDKLLVFLNPGELQGSLLWKAALIEFYGAAVLTFMSSCNVSTSAQSSLQYPPLQIAIFNGLLLTLIIYATVAPSGGHINPLITIATLITGLTSPMRALVYVPAQFLGSAAGSFFYRSGLGLWQEKTTVLQLAGCVVPDTMSLSQAFCIEFASSFFVFIVAFGCALDPVVSRTYGPIYAPVLIGAAVGMVIFSTSQLLPGYTGAGVNPARCFGPTMVGNGEWKAFWLVFFLGPVCAAVVHAPIYLLVPPNHVERSEHKRSADQGDASGNSADQGDASGNSTEVPDATAMASASPAKV